jgi:hypothetical protein
LVLVDGREFGGAAKKILAGLQKHYVLRHGYATGIPNNSRVDNDQTFAYALCSLIFIFTHWILPHILHFFYQIALQVALKK